MRLIIFFCFALWAPLASMATDSYWYCPPCGCPKDSVSYAEPGRCDACFMELLQKGYEGIVFEPTFRYFKGDHPQGSEPRLDDSDWPSCEAGSFPLEDWNGYGWLRYHFQSDKAVWGRLLMLDVTHFGGGLEAWLDGRKIYESGKVGKTQATQESRIRRYSEEIIVQLQPSLGSAQTAQHVLAVYYSNYPNDLGPRIIAGGPRLSFVDPVQFKQIHDRDVKTRTTLEMFLFGFFLAIALVHLLLYLFYPDIAANAYLAGMSFSAALTVLAGYTEQRFTTPAEYVASIRLMAFAGTSLSLFAIRTAHGIMCQTMPKRFRVWLAVSVVIFLVALFFPIFGINALMILWLAGSVEILIVLLLNAGKRAAYKGAWIIALGLLPFGLCVSLQILMTFEINLFSIPTDFPLIFISLMFPMIAMSVFMAYNHARTNQNLKQRVAEVERLSQQTLLQERQNLKMEAEVARKTRELEEARQLQLSMLPKNLPQHERLEIEVYMRTATEVGGDYYDFKLGKDGTLTCAIGDATGHGLQAGIMVAACKSLFTTHAHRQRLDDILKKTSSPLKDMGWKGMFMALSVVRFQDHKVSLAAGGMPFPLVYRAESGAVEIVKARGLPLGAFSEVNYDIHELELKTGDMLLLMSDGLPELFNPDDQLLDFQTVVEWFTEVGQGSPRQVIEELVSRGNHWARGREPKDDITFVAVKAR